MPKKRKEAQDGVTGALGLAVLPEFQPTTKVTKGKLLKVQERVFLRNVEGMLEESFLALRNRVRRHDIKAIQTALEIGGMVKGQRGTTINNTLVQASNNRAESVSGTANRLSFESLVRRLDARDAADREGKVIEAKVS